MCILTLGSSNVYSDLIGYDCMDPSAEVTQVSLLDIKPCIDPTKTSTKRKVILQLLQERMYTSIDVYSCSVTVHQVVQHCGMHSHTSAVEGGFLQFIHYVGKDECYKANIEGEINLGEGFKNIKELTINGITQVSQTLHGSLKTAGDCKGTDFEFENKTYKDVIVTASITVKLNTYRTVINTDEKIVHLRSGITCDSNSRYCFDDSGAEVTWMPKAFQKCETDAIDVLYEGEASILTVNQTDSKYVIVKTNNRVFALQLTKVDSLCNQQIWHTEHSRILVIFDNPFGFYYKKNNTLLSQNVDLMAQISSKLLYLEISMNEKIENLIFDAITKRCHLRKSILKNRLALAMAANSPDIVSGLVKDQVGSMGRVIGEVLYIIRCIPKMVEYRNSETCYQELPVIYRNRSMFMMPVSHIIQEHGTELDCSSKLPAMFHINNMWVGLSPHIEQHLRTPITLDPNDENHTLASIKISPISSHGLYTTTEIISLQRLMMFPNEQRAINNIATRRVIGAPAESQNYYIPNIFSSGEYDHIASKFSDAWWFLSKMGNIVSVLIFLYFTGIFLKGVISIILNYTYLKKSADDRKVSYLLWASLWDSKTMKTAFKGKTKINSEVGGIRRNSNELCATLID